MGRNRQHSRTSGFCTTFVDTREGCGLPRYGSSSVYIGSIASISKLFLLCVVYSKYGDGDVQHTASTGSINWQHKISALQNAKILPELEASAQHCCEYRQHASAVPNPELLQKKLWTKLPKRGTDAPCSHRKYFKNRTTYGTDMPYRK